MCPWDFRRFKSVKIWWSLFPQELSRNKYRPFTVYSFFPEFLKPNMICGNFSDGPFFTCGNFSDGWSRLFSVIKIFIPSLYLREFQWWSVAIRKIIKQFKAQKLRFLDLCTQNAHQHCVQLLKPTFLQPIVINKNIFV